MSARDQERRKYPRYALRLPAILEGLDATNQRFHDVTYTVNISMGGAYVSCDSLIPKDSVLIVTISPSWVSRALNSPFITRARVRHQKAYGGLEKTYGTGLKFLELFCPDERFWEGLLQV